MIRDSLRAFLSSLLAALAFLRAIVEWAATGAMEVFVAPRWRWDVFMDGEWMP